MEACWIELLATPKNYVTHCGRSNSGGATANQWPASIRLWSSDLTSPNLSIALLTAPHCPSSSNLLSTRLEPRWPPPPPAGLFPNILLDALFSLLFSSVIRSPQHQRRWWCCRLAATKSHLEPLRPRMLKPLLQRCFPLL